MSTLFRIILYGVQGFRRNVWLSVIAIITMTLTITTITVFSLSNVVASKKYEEFNNKIDYNIFIRDTASDGDVTQLREQVEARSEVEWVEFVSKEEARKRFEGFFGEINDLKGIISEESNPLPREIDVKFTDPKSIDQFHEFISQERFEQIIERTSYQDNRDLITNYVRLSNFFRLFGFSFTVFFLFIAVLVILNTIRLAIFARREEIEIMRLVGATQGFIRGPFLIEGVIFGLMGALCSGLIAWVVLSQLRHFLETTQSSQSVNFVSDLFGSSFGGMADNAGSFNGLMTQVFTLQVAIGLVLGIICSYIAVRRYLKE